MGATLGTGFLVTPTVVATAKHVVDAANAGAGQNVLVGFAGPQVDMGGLKIRGAFMATAGRVLAVAAQHDLALVEVPEDTLTMTWGDTEHPPRKAARLSRSRTREGTAIAVSGYPLDEPSLVTNAGILASSFSIVEESGRREERHLGDFTANPGNSGGPVYTVADARIVGICVAGRLATIVGGAGSHPAGLTLIVPVAELLQFMDTEGVKTVEKADIARKTSVRRKRRGR